MEKSAQAATWIVPRAELALDGPAAIGPPAVGSRVGPFVLRAVLGRGGMGIVYRAQDERLDRPVALKITAPGKAEPELLRKEARRAAAATHPHVATVFEVGEHDGCTYIAMELVDGESLRQRLSRPLGEREVWSIGGQIADVLAHAHARRLVHRDLKPENVMLRPDGTVKVLDFGLAHVRAGRSDGEPTGDTMIGGTPGYMAPEQRHGHAGDERCDVYAFGVLLHELLTGQRPPLEGLPPSAADALPRRLRELVRTCLQEDPRRRFGHGAALRAAFVERRRRRWPWLGLLALPPLLYALAPSSPAEEPAGDFVALTAQSSTVPVQDADLSPDGKTVVFAERRGLVRLDVATRDAQLLSRSDTYYCVRWFPDGKRVVAYDRGGAGRLLDIDVATGESRVIQVDKAGCAAPSPDGRWLLVETLNGLVLHARSGEQPPRMVLVREAATNVISRVVWSPDSSRFAVLVRPSRSSRARILGIEVPSGARRELVADPWLTASFGLAAMEWETSTRLLYARTPRAPRADEPTVLMALDVNTGETKERARFAERGLADLRFDAARAHMLAVLYKSERDVFVGELDGASLKNLERVTFSEREERMSSWSPDGEQLWLVAETETAHTALRQSLHGYPETVARGWTSWPTESVDGAVYLWELDPEGARGSDPDPRLLRVDGPQPVEVFRTEGDPLEHGLRVPPPFGWRVRCAARAPRCVVLHGGRSLLRVFELPGGEPVFELPGELVDARPSPDGTRFLVVYNRGPLAVVDGSGKELARYRASAGCGYSDAAWLPDGSGMLAAAICLSSADTFQVVHIAGDKTTRLWSAPSVMALDLQVSPDGKKLAFTQESFASDVVLRPWRR